MNRCCHGGCAGCWRGVTDQQLMPPTWGAYMHVSTRPSMEFMGAEWRLQVAPLIHYTCCLWSTTMPVSVLVLTETAACTQHARRGCVGCCTRRRSGHQLWGSECSKQLCAAQLDCQALAGTTTAAKLAQSESNVNASQAEVSPRESRLHQGVCGSSAEAAGSQRTPGAVA